MSTSKPKPQAASQRPIAKPKAMSSKLLTMKFMQRSAAGSTSKNDTKAAREALIQENAKRDAALQAREKGGSVASVGDAETRWELSYVKKIDTTQGGSAGVVDWGYVDLMNGREEEEMESDDEDESVGSGRMVFGKFRAKNETPKPTEDQDSDSDSDASDTPGSSRKKKQGVSLRGLTSISNAGPQPAMKCRGCGGDGHTQAKCPKAKCYACEGVGHMSRDCPRKGKRREPMPFNGGSRDDAKRRRSDNY